MIQGYRNTDFLSANPSRWNTQDRYERRGHEVASQPTRRSDHQTKILKLIAEELLMVASNGGANIVDFTSSRLGKERLSNSIIFRLLKEQKVLTALSKYEQEVIRNQKTRR